MLLKEVELNTTHKTAVFLLSSALVLAMSPSANAGSVPVIMGPTAEVQPTQRGQSSVPGPSFQPTPPDELPQSEPQKATPAPTAAPPTETPPKVNKGVLLGNVAPRDRATTWDLNLEGALGWVLPDTGDSWGDKRFTGFLRARAGILRIHDSWYFSAGPTFETSKLQPVTVGLQGEVMNLEAGLWAQAGALFDGGAHPGAMGAIGWSLFGVEAQYRVYDKYNLGEVPAVYFKLRIPIGVFFSKYAKREK